MSDVWHRYDEVPKHQDIIMTDTGCWAYRADLFALETELERTRWALDVAVDVAKEIDELLSSNRFDVKEVPLLCITQTKISMLLKFINIEQITETKE